MRKKENESQRKGSLWDRSVGPRFGPGGPRPGFKMRLTPQITAEAASLTGARASNPCFDVHPVGFSGVVGNVDHWSMLMITLGLRARETVYLAGYRHEVLRAVSRPETRIYGLAQREFYNESSITCRTCNGWIISAWTRVGQGKVRARSAMCWRGNGQRTDSLCDTHDTNGIVYARTVDYTCWHHVHGTSCTDQTVATCGKLLHRCPHRRLRLQSVSTRPDAATSHPPEACTRTLHWDNNEKLHCVKNKRGDDTRLVLWTEAKLMFGHLGLDGPDHVSRRDK